MLHECGIKAAWLPCFTRTESGYIMSQDQGATGRFRAYAVTQSRLYTARAHLGRADMWICCWMLASGGLPEEDGTEDVPRGQCNWRLTVQRCDKVQCLEAHSAADVYIAPLLLGVRCGCQHPVRHALVYPLRLHASSMCKLSRSGHWRFTKLTWTLQNIISGHWSALALIKSPGRRQDSLLCTSYLGRHDGHVS